MSLSLYRERFDEDTAYELKYQILLKRCDEVKKETDKIYERLLQCKRMLGKVLYERRALRDRLDREYHDGLSQAEVPVFREEDFAYEVIASQRQACPGLASSSSASSDVGTSYNPSLMAANYGSSNFAPSQMLLFNDGSSSSNAAVPVGRLSKAAKSGKKSNNSSNSSVTNCNGGTGLSTSKKDPDAPKKPVNAYFIFCEKKRSAVQMQLSSEQGGEVDRKEVTRRLGQMWGSLADDEKNIYFDEYRKDKERYGIEMEEYTKQRPIGIDESGCFAGLNPFAPSTNICSTAGPSKPKKAKKSSSKSKLKLSNNNSRTTPSSLSKVTSSASSPYPMVPVTTNVTHQDNSALLLPCTSSSGYDDFFRGVVIKAEQNCSVGCFYTHMDDVSSLSSLTPTIGDHTFEPSPLAYIHPPPPLFVTASEDATDEVFLSSTAHLQRHNLLIESPPPGVMATTDEATLEMMQHQQNCSMHSVAMQQLFLHQQSGINEMSVP